MLDPMLPHYWYDEAEIAKLESLLEAARVAVDESWQTVDMHQSEIDWQEERNVGNTAAYCHRIDELEHKLEKAAYLSNLWINGLLSVMTAKQRTESLEVCTKLIVKGFNDKGWEIDESIEPDTVQLEQPSESER